MDRTNRMYQRIFGVIQEEMQGWMNEKFLDFTKTLGLDLSQLQGIASRQAAFDPYQALGLDRSAPDDEIKKRYRELLRKLHPDTAGVEGTAFLLQMVLVAYAMIKEERGWQ
ncbi:DnaJ domain-containing protein [Dehalococcoides mccartyi]|uniref:DnaJ domain-containing protein n=1 Tax=Dehalococcoides mccartyi TaxID=61435 RepID=A0AB38Z865_9CHLR|nr:DnaJ domain-containing protein [Dehalococcoides mccartyi]WRO06741.1 DnaJ domain-containing protein [Dehalococcoides mccartyi]